MEGSGAHTPASMLARASDDIDLHFIQKPSSSDSFKQSFRFPATFQLTDFAHHAFLFSLFPTKRVLF